MCDIHYFYQLVSFRLFVLPSKCIDNTFMDLNYCTPQHIITMVQNGSFWRVNVLVHSFL